MIGRYISRILISVLEIASDNGRVRIAEILSDVPCRGTGGDNQREIPQIPPKFLNLFHRRLLAGTLLCYTDAVTSLSGGCKIFRQRLD